MTTLHVWADVLAVAARQLPEDRREAFVNDMAQVFDGTDYAPSPDYDLDDHARSVLSIWRRTIEWPRQAKANRTIHTLLRRGQCHVRLDGEELDAEEYEALCWSGQPQDSLMLYSPEHCPCRGPR